MSRLRIVLAAALAVSALAVLAVPASASVPVANAKFCKAVKKIGDTSGAQPNKVRAKQLVAGFKKAAKTAPPKVKAAIEKITSYLSVLATGNASKLADLAKSGEIASYPKAITTYSTYVASNCVS
jgi:hypothetical protein